MKPAILIFCMFFLLFTFNISATNPEVSKYLKNLSASLNTEAIDDVTPEIVVQGNTVHVVWIEDKYGVQNPLYYCRSTDLGKTWDNPKLIGKLADKQYAGQPNNRKLAVDGNNVHIAYNDYSYGESGTGRIYYSRSINNGASFEPLKIISTTEGGYSAITRSFVKASNGKVAVAYVGEGAKVGVWVLHSANGGSSFTDKQVFTEGNDLADFYFDGNQMIILHSYGYYYYGLNVGRVYVTVSNDNGTTAKTNKVSVTFPEGTEQKEKCLARHDQHYAKKIAKSGNNIHVVFEGQTESAAWTVLYARSTDNGVTFEKAVDVNNGAINNIQGGQENIAAKNGNVYISYLSTGTLVYFLYSNDNGTKFSTPVRITPAGVSYLEGTWWIGLVTDPTDETGKSVYLTGNAMYSAKSTDGGKSFSKFNVAVPFLKSILADIKSDMACDMNGGLHWISEIKFRNGSDRDIMYKNITAQPAPGTTNSALLIENLKSDYKTELVVVPSAPSLNFDSAMTAEAWVKFYPGTEESVSIFAKVNGSDSYDYVPSGYNIGFRRQNTGKMCINAGIKTDKGDFINWGDCSIGDTLWHHVAITYDANAGLNNFKTYVDGILMTKQTVTGAIIKNNGMLMIGARQAILTWYYYTKYAIDELRLWSRALTQEELLANQVKKFTGQEDSLRLYLNFDNTFKDISGNGNDGIPVYNGTLLKSDFNPPVPAIDVYTAGNQVSFNNKTTNGKSYLWNFGDGTTSDKGNPVYTYTKPGEYKIFLQAANSNSVTGAINNVSIAGLEKIVPDKAGDNGYATLKVYGGGIKNATEFILRKAGELDIKGIDLINSENGIFTGSFDLGGKANGKWDVVVKVGSSEVTLPGSFTIEKGIIKDPWLTFSGRTTVLVNMWQTYTIEVGNDGNTNLYGVPWWFAVSDFEGLEVELIDFDVVLPEVASELGLVNSLNSIPDYIKMDRVMHTDFKARVYSFLIPIIPANSTLSFHIRLKSPEKFKVKTWLTSPLMEYTTNTNKSASDAKELNAKIDFVWCLASSFAEQSIDVGTMMMGNVGCIVQGAKSIYKHIEISDSDQKEKVYNINYHHFITLAQCGMTLINYPLSTYFSIALNFLDFIRDASECSKGFIGISGYEGFIYTVLSFDPNEMIGPAGFGDKHWIQKNNTIPYTILFENKSTATAPAHVVTVKDTLDLTKFDLAEFGFGSFGWGDTIFNMPGNKLKQFSRDIDMRPATNLITRVSGSLDTLQGIVTWEFRSLNPTSLFLEEDPFIGFLPPNTNSPQGEGFVSFSVGLKKELGTNAEIRNKATLFFDENKPIVTNEYLNTLDLDKPESRVYPLDATIDSRFPLAWTGSDKGSGVAAYTIFVLENDTLLYPWKINTSQITADFEGKVGSRYKFYSVATDNVSLMEQTPGSYDAQTTITVDVEQFEKEKASLQVWPNPVNDKLNLVFKGAPCGMYVVELINPTGVAVHSQLYSDTDFINGVEIDASIFSPGQYLLRVVFGNKSETRKILVR